MKIVSYVHSAWGIIPTGLVSVAIQNHLEDGVRNRETKAQE